MYYDSGSRILVTIRSEKFHPSSPPRLTCIYVACKVDEFNVSIDQFVKNLKGDREKYADLILKCELLLMQLLHYHLTVHSAYRPMEGFILDIKVSIYITPYCLNTTYCKLRVSRTIV